MISNMDVALMALPFALVIAAGVAIDTLWVAIFRMAPQGKFKVSINNASSFGFLTTVGAFSIDRNNQVLSFSLPGRSGRVPFSEIKGLEYRAQVKYAMLQEWFFGLGITDVLDRYRDTIEWYSFSVVTTSDVRVPIYLGGQYRPREFLMTWYIDIQAALIRKFGLTHEEGDASRAALELIQQQLRNAVLI